MSKKILYIKALLAAAAGIGIISAIGSSCPTLNPPTTGALAIIKDVQIVFYITTALTYVVSFLSGFLIWAFWAKKSWSYNVTLISSILGTISGLVPAVIVMSNGMKFSPSLMRTIINLIILIMIVIPTVKSDINTFLTEGGNKSSDNIGKQISHMSFVLFGFAFTILIAQILLPATHIIGGVNYWDFEEIQLISALSCLIGGFSMLTGGFLFNIIRPPAHPTRPLE